ncbi:MAG: GNAT family N-acetyltransferase, partial [Actinomycetota bacterium]|nr:GNAT family N-acetyltransferase [Actinomycetota bacterium]
GAISEAGWLAGVIISGMPEFPVREVSSARSDEVTQVLAEAFSDYETMQYMLGGSGTSYSTALRTLVAYFVESHVASHSPILGVSKGGSGELVAAALVNRPSPSPEPVPADSTDALGPDVIRRIHNFEAASSPLEPEFGFYYIGMIGVADEHRGQGYGRLIIDDVVDASASDRESEGVLLTTENEANVNYYQSIGFEILGEATTEDGGLRSWTLFRSDD